MSAKSLSSGVAHPLPADLKKALLADVVAHKQWESITPLARNEWICWVLSVKRDETRKEHVRRVCTQLKEGKRRPCCWIGCTHRTDKPMSASQKFLMGKRLKKS